MAINKPSNETKATIIRKSVKSLPNSPSREGFSAEEIKKAMYDFVTGNSNSVMSEIDRIVDEINEENSTTQENNANSLATKMDKNNPTGTGTFSLTGNQEISGTSQASGFKTPSGTSNQFLKADGSKDSTTYQPANDNNLNTSFKSIVGAINEIKTGTDSALSSINSKIPDVASSSNKLVDTNTMNSSISTATATFKGSFNLVSDLNLTITATEEQIATALATATSSEDNNDYAFVKIPTANDTPTLIDRTDRYKFNGSSWAYEYTLNTSGFTAAQWEALNSGITQDLVDTYITYEEVEELDPSAPAPIVTAVSNPNLLINGDFSINQRGQASYITTSNLYTVDGWKLLTKGGSFTVETKTLASVSSGNTLLTQYLPLENGIKVTLSVKVDGNIYSLTGITSTSQNIATTFTNGYFRLQYNSTKGLYEFTVAASSNKSIVVDWCKLEVGEIATKFVPLPYEAELAMCQMPKDNNAISTTYSNSNLLINGDFKVNQRGQTSYTGNNKYTADRWQQGSGTFDYSTKTWTPSTQYSGFVQKIEDIDKFKGQTITLSVKTTGCSTSGVFDLLINDGSNHRTGTPVASGFSGVKTFTYTVPQSATQLRIGLIYLGTSTTDNISIDWVKAEIGSITTPFSPRPYAEELALCQRYYQRFNTSDNYSEYALGFLASKTSAQFQFPLTQTLRTTPTIIVSDNSDFTVRFGNQSDGTLLQIATTGISLRNAKQNNVFLTANWATELNINYGVATLRSRVSTSYIAFDAEIY